MGYSRALCYAAALSLGIAWTTAAPAEQTDFVDSGNGLLETCTGESSHLSLCMGYIQGVVDTTRMMQETPGARHYMCVPNGVTVGQSKDIVVKYLRDHPENRQGEGDALIVLAMMQAFPCPRTK